MSLITEQVRELRNLASIMQLMNMGGKVHILDDAADTIEMLSAKCRDRWIPISERLPDKDGVYIVTEHIYSMNDRDHKKPTYTKVETVEFENGRWKRASIYEVIAWQPFPKPYEEDAE